MDSVLSVLVTTISAMDIIEVLMYFAAHLRGDTLQPPAGTDHLDALKSNIKETISQTPVPENSFLTCAQDGTLFKDQYRVDVDIDAQKLDEINHRVDVLANRVINSERNNNNNIDSSGSSSSNIANGNISRVDDKNERTSDQNNNVTCLTDKNNNNNAADAAVKVHILASDAVTTTTNTENELLASVGTIKSTPNIDMAANANQTLIEIEKRENETSLDSCYESLGSDATASGAASVVDSNRLRPLTREDEFRHTIKKRSSVSSIESHDSRIEELQALTSLEQVEQQHIDDYMPIIYPGSPLIDVLADSIETDNEPELETIIEVHSSSPDEPAAEDELTVKRFAFDKSPVPNIGVQMSLPWGDVKKEKENKARDLLSLAKSTSIEEIDVEERIDAAKETKKWIENCEAGAIKEELDLKEDEQVEEPVITVIRKRSLKSGNEAQQGVTEQEEHHVTEIQKTVTTAVEASPNQSPIEEPVVIQKRINLIGIQSPTTDTNKNKESTPSQNVSEKIKEPKHDDRKSSRQSPMVRRRDKDANAPKFVSRDSEDYEDSEEASLLHSIKDDRLELDVDNQYMDDPQIKEMADYVKKLTKAKVASVEEDDEEEEYYWKPQQETPSRRKSVAEVLIVPKSESPKLKAANINIAEDLALEREALEYKEHWRLDNLKVDDDVFNVQHFNSPRASGYRSKSHSIAYESSKFAGHRRDSLAEMLIIPKTVKESCESCDHLLQQLENEALEYQYVWGIDVPKLKEQRRNRSQSITVAQLSRRRETGHGDEYNNRRESIAELLIVPRTVRDSIDESVLLQLENEALAYQFAWNLNPEEVGRRTKNRSMSISMGVLSRKKRARPSISKRRQSLAEAIIVPKDHAGMVVDDPHLLSLLENEAYEYKQAFGLRTPEIMEPFCEEEQEQKPDYNEWFHRFDDQSTAHIETSSFTDDEDEEVASLLENSNGEAQVQNHIFYTFPHKGKTPPSKSATPDTVIKVPIRPTTPADYDNYMQKFPDQLSPEIQMDDGRKSPATLETYMVQNRLSPIPSPRAVTPEPLLPPPTMEVYLERMRSASPQPLPSIEIETSAIPVIQPTTTPSVAFPTPRALTPIRTMQHPPSLETYLQRLRSQSPQAETEY